MGGTLATCVVWKLASLIEALYQEKYIESVDYYVTKMHIRVLMTLIYALSAEKILRGL